MLKQIEPPPPPQQQQQFLLPLQHDRTEKLCARHRLPSLCYSSSENTNSIVTTTTAAGGAQPKFLRRRKFASSNNFHPGSLSSSYSTTVHDMQDIQSSSMSSSYKTSKYFDRVRTEKKLRRYKMYNNSINNTNNSNSNATLKNNESFCDSKSSQLFSTSVPINIPKITLKKAPASSFDDTESVLTVKESNSEDDDDDVEDDAIECDDEENDDVYDNKEFSLNKNYRLLKKKLKKISRRVGHEDNDAAIGGATAVVNSKSKCIDNNNKEMGIKMPTASSITTINELNEINLDFSFLEDNDKIEIETSVNNDNNNNNNNDNNNESQLDFDTYLDKFELNVFGSIDN